MAEWSKAQDLGSCHASGAGSNPVLGTFDGPRRTRVVDCIETDGRRATRGHAVPVRPLVRAAAPHAVEGELQARLGLRRHLLLRGGALAQRLGGDGNAPDERGRAEHVHEEVVVVGARRLGFLNVKVDS